MRTFEPSEGDSSAWTAADRMVSLPDGSVVVAGLSFGEATLAAGRPDAVVLGIPDAFTGFLARFSPAGDLIWHSVAGAKAGLTVRDVDALPDGTIAVGAGFERAVRFAYGEPSEQELVADGPNAIGLACFAD